MYVPNLIMNGETHENDDNSQGFSEHAILSPHGGPFRPSVSKILYGGRYP